jgi:hypothetical protein
MEPNSSLFQSCVLIESLFHHHTWLDKAVLSGLFRIGTIDKVLAELLLADAEHWQSTKSAQALWPIVGRQALGVIGRH